MNFQEIINQLDTAISENPDLNIEQAIDIKLTEMGIDEATRSRVKEACALIDNYNDEYSSLQKAKAHGKSRDAWLEHRIDKVTEQFPEEEKNIILAAIVNKLKKLRAWITNS